MSQLIAQPPQPTLDWQVIRSMLAEGGELRFDHNAERATIVLGSLSEDLNYTAAIKLLSDHGNELNGAQGAGNNRQVFKLRSKTGQICLDRPWYRLIEIEKLTGLRNRDTWKRARKMGVITSRKSGAGGKTSAIEVRADATLVKWLASRGIEVTLTGEAEKEAEADELFGPFPSAPETPTDKKPKKKPRPRPLREPASSGDGQVSSAAGLIEEAPELPVAPPPDPERTRLYHLIEDVDKRISRAKTFARLLIERFNCDDSIADADYYLADVILDDLRAASELIHPPF